MLSRKSAPLALLLAGGLIFSGCTQMAIEQGSYLLKEDVDQIHSGMSRPAVRRALGKPLLQDPFHPDRWDYIYTRVSEEGEKTYRRFTLRFDSSGEVTEIERAGAEPPTGYSPDSPSSS